MKTTFKRKHNPNDYRTWTLAQLNVAIMYQVQYGRDTQHLDHLLAARGKRGEA